MDTYLNVFLPPVSLHRSFYYPNRDLAHVAESLGEAIYRFSQSNI
jgi:hypothetical protein